MEIVKDPDNTPEQRLIRMVDAYQRPLLTLCCMLLRDASLAEDAVQETFLRAYRGLNSFRGDSSEKTWLTRIAVNICRDLQRSAWMRYVTRSITPEELPLPAEGFPDPDDGDLAAAILRLPTKYREAIMMYYYQQMTMDEIAGIAGISPSMVSRRLAHARAKLRRLMEKGDLDE